MDFIQDGWRMVTNVFAADVSSAGLKAASLSSVSSSSTSVSNGASSSASASTIAYSTGNIYSNQFSTFTELTLVLEARTYNFSNYYENSCLEWIYSPIMKYYLLFILFHILLLLFVTAFILIIIIR